MSCRCTRLLGKRMKLRYFDLEESKTSQDEHEIACHLVEPWSLIVRDCVNSRARLRPDSHCRAV